MGESRLLWCPHVGSIEPHLVIRTPSDYIAWCQTCFMVQVIPRDDDDGMDDDQGLLR